MPFQHVNGMSDEKLEIPARMLYRSFRRECQTLKYMVAIQFCCTENGAGRPIELMDGMRSYNFE